MSLRKPNKKIHFVGIGGAGMSGLAEILLAMGHKVSGSDKEKSETTLYLEKCGATVFEGHQHENLGDAELLIYSSAVPKDNPEMLAAKEKNVPCIRRAELLGQLMLKKTGIAVAGTHGKTTTTSMISKLLIDAGFDPTVVVGGRLKNLKTNARLGKGNYFVTEADEYDRSFLTLFPTISIITSLEEDHLDIYSGLQDLRETFVKFANQTAFDGLVILCADNKNSIELSAQVNSTVVSYGLSDKALIKAENIETKDGRTTFYVSAESRQLDTITLQMPGSHNIQNALAAVTVGLELDIPFETIASSLSGFSGVQRRFEFKGQTKDILVYDDYAHHPTEVAATLQAAKTSWDRRVVVLFQPHLFSRTRDFAVEFADALTIADKIILAEIYPAREKPMSGVTSQLIADKIKKPVLYIRDKNELVKSASAELKSGDMLITMGAGDIWKYGEMILKNLSRQK